MDEGVLGTGDAVGAQDVRHGGDFASEAGVGPWGVLGERDQDVGLYAQTHLFWCDGRSDRLDDTIGA
jgi:hypothetical protein